MKAIRYLGHLLLGLALLGVASCAQPSEPVAVETPAAPAAELQLDRLVSGLLSCRPLPYAEATRVIGPAGGVISVGPHRLYFPPGALAAPVAITAVAPSDSVNSVQLSPHGLQFEGWRKPLLTLSYRNCSLVGRLIPKRIVYTTDLLQILEVLLSFDNPLRSEVTAPLDHFSRYAVAW